MVKDHPDSKRRNLLASIIAYVELFFLDCIKLALTFLYKNHSQFYKWRYVSQNIFYGIIIIIIIIFFLLQFFF